MKTINILGLELEFSELKILNVVAMIELARYEPVRIESDWTSDMNDLKEARKCIIEVIGEWGELPRCAEVMIRERHCRALIVPLEIEYERIKKVSVSRWTDDMRALESAFRKIRAAVGKIDPDFNF